MMWKCEIQNSYTGKDVWTEVELIGTDFMTALWKRFGRINFRNVEQYDPIHNRWVPVEIKENEKSKVVEVDF